MSHLFLEMVDRPIAFQRAFVRLGAGVTGALLLSQMVYWHNRMDGKWFYKTQAQLEEETGLSRYEQEGARKKLVATGVLEESKKGIPAKLYFRVDGNRLQELLFSTITGVESSKQGCGKPTSCNAENQQAGMGNYPEQSCGNHASIPSVDYTETTSEITSESKSHDAPAKASAPTKNSLKRYSDEFEQAWQAYPKRPNDSKSAAGKSWSARIKSGVTAEAMLAGVQRYAAYVVATGKAGTEYIKQASTFFGPDHHFEQLWTVPAAAQSQSNTQQKHSGFQNRDYGQTQMPAWAKGK